MKLTEFMKAYPIYIKKIITISFKIMARIRLLFLGKLFNDEIHRYNRKNSSFDDNDYYFI